MMRYFLGIDIGGSHIKYGIGNRKSGIISSSSLITPNTDLYAFKGAFTRIVEDVMKLYPQYPISAIGIGSPGTIDFIQAKIMGINPNLPFWSGQDPRDLIPADYNIPVYYDNDANLMALAEAEGANEHKIVLGLTIGTGIGGGLVIDHEVYHGHRGFAMELGHTVVEMNGQRCKCGLQGCLEVYSSLTGLRLQMAAINPDYAQINPLDMLHYAKEDQQVAEIIMRGQKYLAQAIANYIIILDPGLVVIGGGIMDSGLYNCPELVDQIMTLLPQVNRHTVVKKAELGNQAGILGGIVLSERRFAQSAE